MSETNTKKEMRDTIQERVTQFKPWAEKAVRDLNYADGKQWEDTDVNEMKRKKKFVSTFNVIMKHLLLVTGMERRNRSDMRALPQEGDDEIMGSIMSAVLKWQMGVNYGSYHLSESFWTSLKMGIGWLTLDVRREMDDLLADPLGQGEIVIGSRNPLYVMPDPSWTRFDLSDCRDIIHSVEMSKRDAKHHYPEVAKELDRLKAINRGSRLVPKFLKPLYGDQDSLEVVERWMRTYVKRHFLINLLTGEAVEGESREMLREFVRQEQPADLHSQFQILSVDQPKIQLDTLIENEILIASDGDNPLELSVYPFIPVRCYFDPNQEDMDLKIMGMARGLIDTQNLFNKLMSEVQYQMIVSAWKTIAVDSRNDSLTDEELLDSGGNAGIRILRMASLDGYKELDSSTFDSSLLNVAGTVQGLFNLIGNNPDLQGMVSDPGAPGVATNMRIQQGDNCNAPIFDNLALSMEMLGRALIELSNKCYTPAKVQRIVGKDLVLPEDFEARRKDARFDISIGLFSQSPSHRYLQYLKFQELLQQGILEMQPEVAQIYLELADLDASLKERILSMIKAAAEQAAQAQPPPGAPPVPGGAPSEAPIAEPPMEVPVEEGPPPELVAQVAEQYGVTPEEALVLLQQQAAQPA